MNSNTEIWELAIKHANCAFRISMVKLILTNEVKCSMIQFNKALSQKVHENCHIVSIIIHLWDATCIFD